MSDFTPAQQNTMFFSLPNHRSSSVVRIPEPWALPQAPALPKGEARTAWAAALSTQHHFISLFEGENAALRITKTGNTPARMHGLIADYDNDHITDEMLAEAARGGSKGLVFPPQWTLRTMTPGRARLVWVFEEAVFLPPTTKGVTSFLKTLASELGLEDLLPGFDKASLSPTQYFELGHSWTPTGVPAIPSEMLGMWLLSSIKPESGGRIVAPIEEVAKKIEETWPGRWPGKFEVGARGPLFWVEPFVERVGCIVMEHGIYSHSSRADKQMKTWEDFFGRDWVRRFEADRIGSMMDNIWYDGRSYWWGNGEGLWTPRSKEDSVMHLKNRGMSGKTSGKETISEAEKVLVAVQDARTVDYAAPVLFEAGDLVMVNGDRVLNISRREVTQPAAKATIEDFPWIWEFVNKIWDDFSVDGLNQRDFFLAWLKRLWKSGYNRHLAQGQMLVIAGGAGQGKTFLNRCIIGGAMGGSIDASSLLQGESNFNKQACEVAIWRIDDGTSQATASGAMRFAETLKRHVANPTAQYHPKFRDALELPWMGRIVITCNTDPDSLSIIPALDNTMKDKVILLKFRDDWKPSFSTKNEENEERVAAELPYFLRWLHDWETPDACRDPHNPRYGIKAIHHPEMLRAAREGSSAHSVQEALDMWLGVVKQVGGGEDVLKMTTAELLTRVQELCPGITRSLTAQRFGRDLRKLVGVWPPLERIAIKDGYSSYHIRVR